jgi:Tfp pilus assembly protein PilF
MRPVSSRTFLPFLAPIGILVLAIHSLAAAPQQDSGARNAPPATLNQALSDSAAAIQRHDYQAARESALQATAIDPKNPSAWFYLARSYNMLRDFPKAEEAYKTLIAFSPRHTEAYNNLGNIYLRTGRTEEAIASYRKQIEVAPRGRFACWNLSTILASQGRWDEARPLAAFGAELAPEDVNRWAFLGKAQIQTGRIDEARRSVDRALALPHQPMMDNNVAYDMADAGFDLDKSWQLISKALDATPPSVCQPEGLSDGDKCTTPLRQLAHMLDTAGWVLYRQGKIKDAEPYLRSAFAISPISETELHVVVVLAKSGRLEEAVDLFAQARSRPDFVRVDSQETMRELLNAAGGGAELDALLERAPLPLSPLSIPAKAVALVDSHGKVIDVRAVAPAAPGLTEAAKAATLPVLSWPGYSLRSIRTIEFQRTGDRWSPSDSYAGEAPAPPPCGSAPQRPTLMTQLSTPTTPSAGCPGAY